MKNLLREIADKVNPDKEQELFLADLKNSNDSKTVTDERGIFSKIKDDKDLKELLEAFYSKNYNSLKNIQVSIKGAGKFSIYDIKTNKSFDVNAKIDKTKHQIIITNLQNKNKTITIELSTLVNATSQSSTKKTFAETIIKNLEGMKNKSPKEIKQYLKTLID